ncbi:MAG: AmmeMemoRadiSam system protein A [Steroidobacterales bacterium]
MTLSSTQRRDLLALADESIRRGLVDGRLPTWQATTLKPDLEVQRASFATLRIDDLLRGCCGTLRATRTLAEDVWCNAWASAFADSRFTPLTHEEYLQLDLQISVLSPLEPVYVASELELRDMLRPGVDGLVLELGSARATFLPAVWEQLPDAREFLAHLKHKAGLPAGFWSPQLQLYRYTTECFEAEL